MTRGGWSAKGIMRELHLFAGGGGGILGGMLLGHSCVCAVEVDEKRRKALLQRQRDGILSRFPIWDDVCTFDGTPWRGNADVIAGGFPCQDISASGPGTGIQNGDRSGLWFEMARIISEVRPAFVFVENSPMLVSRGLDIILSDLAARGYDAEWDCFGADSVGLNHHRSRLWLVAYPKKMYSYARNLLGASNGKYTARKPGRLPCISLCQKRWESHHGPFYSPVFRMSNDGMADRLDSLAALGDGQVPAVAANAWRILTGRIIARLSTTTAHADDAWRKVMPGYLYERKEKKDADGA